MIEYIAFIIGAVVLGALHLKEIESIADSFKKLINRMKKWWKGD